jgi:hypothetical protein
MVDKTHPKQAQDEAAFVEAYEQRLAGGAPEQVPPLWRAEIEELVKLHAQIAAIPLPEVAPSVRAVVLSAAAQAVADRPVSVWAKLASFLLRPGPILVGATAAAVIFALAVRDDKPRPSVDSGAVALLENADSPAAAPVEVPAAAEEPPAAAPQAAPPIGQAAPGAAPALDPAVPSAAGAAPALAAAPAPRPGPADKAIAAEPASVAPQGAADMAMNTKGLRAADEAKPRGEQQAAKADDALEDQAFAGQKSRGAAPEPMLGAVANSAGQNQVEKRLAAEAEKESAPKVQEEAAQVQRKAPVAPAQVQAAQARQDADAANVAADSVKDLAKSQAAVANLRAEIEKTSDPAKRAALLLQLLSVAQQSGDAKATAWAKSQLAAQGPSKAAAGKSAGSQAAPAGQAGQAEKAEKAESDKSGPAKVKASSY